jgi:hypothetical protein
VAGGRNSPVPPFGVRRQSEAATALWLLPLFLIRFQPNFMHGLVDLSRIPMEAIGCELVLRLALSLLKAAGEGRLDLWLERFGPFLRELAEQPDRLGLFRTMMVYALAAEGKSSTMREFVSKVKDEKVKADVMSLAETLIQQGRQEGRIQFCQELQGLPVMTSEELARRQIAELQTMLRELEARLKHR